MLWRVRKSDQEFLFFGSSYSPSLPPFKLGLALTFGLCNVHRQIHNHDYSSSLDQCRKQHDDVGFCQQLVCVTNLFPENLLMTTPAFLLSKPCYWCSAGRRKSCVNATQDFHVSCSDILLNHPCQGG